MIKKFSEAVVCEQQSSIHVTLQITIEPDLFWFQGHFDTFPLLAGVAQIDWVMHYFAQYIRDDLQFNGIQQVKFQQPIVPNDVITLTLDAPSDTLLTFEFKADATKSKGKIRLKPKG